MKRILGLVLIAYLVGTSLSLAQSRQDLDSSLKTVKELADTPNQGYGTPTEIKAFQFGTPFDTYFVGLDTLAKFKAGDDASALLKPRNVKLFPIYSGDRVAAEAELRVMNGKWEMMSLAHNAIKQEAAISSPATSIREDIAGAKKLAAEDIFVVTVPSLGMTFAGYKSEGNLYLVPLFDYQLKAGSKGLLKSGVPIKASDAFTALQAETTLVNPNVPDSYQGH